MRVFTDRRTDRTENITSTANAGGNNIEYLSLTLTMCTNFLKNCFKIFHFFQVLRFFSDSVIFPGLKKDYLFVFHVSIIFLEAGNPDHMYRPPTQISYSLPKHLKPFLKEILGDKSANLMLFYPKFGI